MTSLHAVLRAGSTGAAAVLVSISLAACAGGGPGDGGGSGGGSSRTFGCLAEDVPLALAIGARANNPRPALDPMTGLVRGTADKGKQITLVRVDGAPKVVYDKTFTSTGGNGGARNDDLLAYLGDLKKVMNTGVTAATPEAGPLAALSLAGRAAGEGGNVVLIDSGLQTTAPLDFRQPGLLDADAGEVVDFLRKNRELPDLTGRHVLLSGIGATATPQRELDDRVRGNLLAIWKKIVTAAGGKVCVDDRPNNAAPVEGVPAVSAVTPPPPPQPDFKPCGTTELGEDDHVGFVRGKAVFREPDGARATLRKLADTVRDGRQQVALTGTTSSEGGADLNRRLSQARASKVRDELIALGVPAGRVTATGVGSDFPGFVPDTGPNGLLPGPAARNRKVIVELTCP